MKQQKNLRVIMPGMLTMGNLTCGYLSILTSFQGKPFTAAGLILLGAFMDLMDGKVARWTRSASQMGVELDSFADITTFGIAPSFLIYTSMLRSYEWIGIMAGVIYVMAVAMRLSRFNLTATTGEKGAFTGLPSPAGALTLVAYVYFTKEVWPDVPHLRLTVGLVMLVSYLMVSSFKYASAPNFDMRSRKSQVRLLIVLLSILAMCIDFAVTFFPIAVIYVASGIVQRFVSLFRRKGATPYPVDEPSSERSDS